MLLNGFSCYMALQNIFAATTAQNSSPMPFRTGLSREAAIPSTSRQVAPGRTRSSKASLPRCVENAWTAISSTLSPKHRLFSKHGVRNTMVIDHTVLCSTGHQQPMLTYVQQHQTLSHFRQLSQQHSRVLGTVKGRCAFRYHSTPDSSCAHGYDKPAAAGKMLGRSPMRPYPLTRTGTVSGGTSEGAWTGYETEDSILRSA